MIEFICGVVFIVVLIGVFSWGFKLGHDYAVKEALAKIRS